MQTSKQKKNENAALVDQENTCNNSIVKKNSIIKQCIKTFDQLNRLWRKPYIKRKVCVGVQCVENQIIGNINIS